MIFPLTIKKRIILNLDEYPISSDMYIVGHISDYMTQFGMMEQRRADNELFYLNMDPFKSLARRRFMRNLSIKVEVTNNQVVITLETAAILLFLIAVLSFIVPFFLPPAEGKIFIPVMVVSIVAINYGIILIVLNMYISEIETLVRSLK